MKRFLLLVAVLAPILACAGTEGEEAAADDGLPAVDTLVVIDSIGVMMGDSTLMFGSITSAEALPGGGAVLFDRITGLISVFDSDGRLVSSFGGLGEAPGEFLLPGLLTVLGDGRLAASDWRAGQVRFFSRSGEYLGSRPAPGTEMPMSIAAAGDSCFITYSCPSRQYGDTFRMGYELTAWEGMNEQPRSVIHSHLFDLGREDCDFRPGYIAAAAGADGLVYLHRMGSSEYAIEVFDLDGTPVLTISGDGTSVPFEQVGRYTNLPLAYFFVQMEGRGEQLTGELPRYAPQVEKLGVGPRGLIWAQRGTTDELFWDIFSPEGELRRHAVLPFFPDTAAIRVEINRHGMVAWDRFPEDYPRLYLISIEDADI